MKSALESFWDRVSPEPNSGCWLWIGSADKSGYGHFSNEGKYARAHRWAYEHFIGPIPQGQHVCHRCDVTCCVNPDHLFAGTNRENFEDLWRKGRHAWQLDPPSKARGEKINTSKLTEREVIAIRRAHSRGQQQKLLAKRYGLSHSTVNAIVHRQTWRHLPIDSAHEGE